MEATMPSPGTPFSVTARQDDLRRAVRHTRSGARDAAHSRTLDWLARLGLAARAVVYLLIGVLAIVVATGHSRPETDQNGALRTVAGQPFGKAVLWLLALGFAGYALWQLSQVAFGETGGDPGAKGRVKSAVRGLVYA